jgi:hypothetical protein
VHTGECDLIDREVTGLALHVATRIAELAEPGMILTSSTVRDLVAGAGIRFGESHEVDLAGMAGPRSVFEVLRRGIAPDTVRRYAIDHANVLRLDGEYWTVVHDGHIVTLRDSKGLRDIARLVAEPHREHHVLDLASPADREGRTVLAARGTEPIIDDTARARYKRRIDELQADIDDARSRGDGETESRLREELEALVDELSSAYGLGGHVRRAPDNVERARKAVTRRVRDAVLRVERAHPTLGRHLRASVRTGVFCSYAPEHELTWLVEPTPDG